MDYKGLAEQLVKKCLTKGADAAEIYLQLSRNLDVEVRNGEVEKIEQSTSQGVGFRVFVKGKMSFSNCNALDDKSLDNALKSAVRFALITTPDENNVLPDDEGMTEVSGLYDPEISKIPLEKKIELAKTVEKLAMKDSRITKSAGSGYSEGEGEVFLANSNGMS
jgi:PmbA protein